MASLLSETRAVGAGGPQARTRNARGQGARLRKALMGATAELLLEHGSAERLSIRSITARAGVSPTALYLHFAGKDELLKAVCDDAFRELGSYLDTAVATEAEPRERLRALGKAYIRFARRRPGHYRILFGTPGRFAAGRPGSSAEDPGMAAFEVLVRTTASCLGEGVEPRAVALQLWIALHGYVSLRNVMPAFRWPTDESFLAELYEAHLGAGSDARARRPAR